MKCLYCHENVQPDGETCPKCGLPLIEDTTLLEFREAERPSVLDWVGERKPLLLAGAGGFAAALLVGLIFLTATAQGRSSAPSAATPATTPQPVRLTSAGSFGTTPAVPRSTVSDVAPTPVLGTQAPVSTPAPLSLSVDEGDIQAPPPLPANYDYDPQWGFPPVPKAQRAPAPEMVEPTPPQHVLAMSPFRARREQYVTVVARNVGGSAEFAGETAGGSFTLDGE